MSYECRYVADKEGYVIGEYSGKWLVYTLVWIMIADKEVCISAGLFKMLKLFLRTCVCKCLWDARKKVGLKINAVKIKLCWCFDTRMQHTIVIQM
jgi:hypothetical protein